MTVSPILIQVTICLLLDYLTHASYLFTLHTKQFEIPREIHLRCNLADASEYESWRDCLLEAAGH